MSSLSFDNVAFIIAKCLEEGEAEKAANAKRKTFYESLAHYEVKGKRPPFDKYKKNLRYGFAGVHSYGSEEIESDLDLRTAKRLGRWSRTTSKHQNYAIKNLAYTWGCE